MGQHVAEARYSRHDGGDGKELGHQVGQVAVHEDEEGLDGPNVAGEACGERRHKAEQQAEAHASEPHHEEASHPQEYIHWLHLRHVRHVAKHVVQHLTQTHKEHHGGAFFNL